MLRTDFTHVCLVCLELLIVIKKKNQISFQFVSGNDLKDCDQNDIERVLLNKAFNPNFNHNVGNVI